MIIGTITLLTLLLGGGGGAFSFEKAFNPFVEEVVVDKARYEEIKGLSEQADDELEAYRKEVADVWSEELKALLEDFDSSRDDFRRLRKKTEGSRTSLQDKLLDTRMKVVAKMSEDEWNAMFAAADKKAADEKDKK